MKISYAVIFVYFFVVNKLHQCSGGGGNTGLVSSPSPRGNQSPCKSPVIPSTHAFTPLMLTPNPSPISSGYGLSAKTLFWECLNKINKVIQIYIRVSITISSWIRSLALVVGENTYITAFCWWCAFGCTHHNLYFFQKHVSEVSFSPNLKWLYNCIYNVHK